MISGPRGLFHLRQLVKYHFHTMKFLGPTFFAAEFFFLLAFLQTSEAHAILCNPRQRGAYRSSRCGSNLPVPANPVIDYCPHCLNGGGVGTVAANMPSGGWKKYDPINDFDGCANRAGLCGDAKGGEDHLVGGRFMPYSTVPIVAKWTSGAVVDVTVQVDTNHNGYFDFFLCNLDACGTPDIQSKCFKEGHCHKLKRIPKAECENPTPATHMKCGPVDSQNKGSWYVPCRNSAGANQQLFGGSEGTMKYKLPDGVRCAHCVMQWYYATGNSCAPPGFLEYMETYERPFGTTCDSDGGGRGAHRIGMNTCGGSTVPEEFWSCADVEIA